MKSLEVLSINESKLKKNKLFIINALCVGFINKSKANFVYSMLAFGVLITCIWSCGQIKNENQKKVFHFNQHNAVTSLDPAFCKSQANIWVVNQLYNSLVQLDDSLNIKPCIAKSWHISNDGLTYEFTLRNDVFFQDDNEVFPKGQHRKCIAADVVYAFNRIISADLSSPGSWVFKGKIDEKNPFSAPNDSTFILKLNKPFRPMLGILTMQYCSIVAKEAVDYWGKDFRAHPVGTGPFYLKNWIQGQALFLKKNELYFEKDKNNIALPYLDGIRMSCISERKTAYLELITNKLDYLFGLESSYVNQLVTAKGELQPAQRERFNFNKSPYLNSEYIGFNTQQNNAALMNKKVRQALNYALDRKSMLKALRNSVGVAANAGFVPKGLPSFDPSIVKGYYFDPDKARNLLAEAGYPNGKNMPEINLLTSQDYLDLCTFIAHQWSEIGVNCKIDVMEAATLREMMSKGQAPMFRGSWLADYPDAESFLGVFYSKNPSPPNYTRFNNPTFDKLYESALQENDDKKRYAIYQQMDNLLIEEAPVVFLFYDEIASFSQKKVLNFNNNPINLLSLKSVKM